jgi:6-pyruvoyltetrahydropterin/6-carboxytetrahydropterin synthase
VRVTRKYRFSASHRLHTPALPDARNAELYGKCNNPFGHGHDYTVHVSVSGEIHPVTGRVINPGELDRYVRERVLDGFDHRDMNADIDEFRSIVPTTENLALVIDRRLRDEWDGRFGGASLDSIRIEETPRNTFELRST